MGLTGLFSHSLRHNKDTGAFIYTDDPIWSSEQKCHDRNKPDTWQVKWCPDKRPTPKPTKEPTNNRPGTVCIVWKSNIRRPHAIDAMLSQ